MCVKNLFARYGRKGKKMNTSLIIRDKNYPFSFLFELYIKTAQNLINEMKDLFESGTDFGMNMDSRKEEIKKETINSMKYYLNRILVLKDSKPFFKYLSEEDYKLFQQFLFKNSNGYLLCSSPQFQFLSAIEICLSELLTRNEGEL